MIAFARVREIVVRLASVLSRRRGGTEIDDELETHLAFATDEYVRRGLPRDEARRLALIEAGGVTGAVEAYRDQRGLPFLDRLWQDVRFGARMLRRSPGFAVVAVAAIGLAIGVNSAMFTLVDAMMWQPIPVVNPQRMVKLIGINARGQQNIRFSYSHYKNIATHSTTIEDVVGYDG